MINKYTFYYSCNEYIAGISEEIYSVNGHRISKDVYNKLFEKVSQSYKLHTTQQCAWSNRISGAHTFSDIDVFKRKEKDNNE